MTQTRRLRVRILAGLCTTALAISVAPFAGLGVAGAADELPPTADPVSAGAFCDGAPSTNPFTDLGGDSLSTRKVILCLVATDLTQGTSPSTYSPGGAVTRRQMALFIKRLADLFDTHETPGAEGHSIASLPAYDGKVDYKDIAADDPAAEAIGQLSQAEVVGGFSDDTYRPNAPVSRRQMAAFVNRLEDFLVGAPYDAGSADYFDDDNGDSGEDNLNALASVGIFQGDGHGNVDPGASLTRRQMANILLRDAQVHFAARDIVSPFKGAGNAAFSVTPAAVEIRHLATEPSATDDRAYTVRGLASGTSYTIQLFAEANVQGRPNFTFTETGATNTAAPGTVAARITVVNGAAVTVPDDSVVTKPVGGQITFTVDGVSTETIVPVLFVDADSDGALDLKADDSPVAAEPFGVGGATRFLPPEAALGARTVTIGAVAAERDAFVAGGVTYFLDGNDTYRYQGVGITAAQFDSIMSLADVLAVSYNPDPTRVSIFDITTDNVSAPAAPAASVINADSGASANDVRLSYIRPADNSSAVSYTLQRAELSPLLPGQCALLVPGAPTFTNVATATQAPSTGPGAYVFSDNNVPSGCYQYRVVATSPISGNSAPSAASDTMSISS